MKKAVLILEPAPTAEGIATMLRRSDHYSPTAVTTPEAMTERLHNGNFYAVIIDIDMASVDNRTICSIARSIARPSILCVSQKRLHPDLQNAIRDCAYACMTKPIDSQELFYWLRCIGDAEEEARDPPPKNTSVPPAKD